MWVIEPRDATLEGPHIQKSLAHLPPANTHTKELKRNMILPHASGRPSKETPFISMTPTALLMSVFTPLRPLQSFWFDKTHKTSPHSSRSLCNIYSVFQVPSHCVADGVFFRPALLPPPLSSVLSHPLPILDTPQVPEPAWQQHTPPVDLA